MKLTLVNKCGVSMKFEGNEHVGMQWWYSSSTLVDIIPPDLLKRRDNDFIAKNLLWSRVTDSNSITLKVYLTRRQGKEGESLQIKSTKGEDDILKQLRKTFGDSVKISVCIKPTIHNPGGAEERMFVFQEGLIIRKDGYCEGNVVRIHDFNLRETHFDISVIADIPDDHYLIKEVQEEISGPLRATRKILNEGVGSDIIIIAGNGAEIKSHMSFLMASSAVFKRMLRSKIKESKTGRVDMTDLSEEGVHAFLHYLYCGDTVGPETDLNLAFELLYASHKYEVTKLEKFMISFWMGIMDERIGVDIAFETYVFVRGIENASELKTKMIRILHRKYDELKVLPEYAEFFKTPKDAMELCDNLVNIC